VGGIQFDPLNNVTNITPVENVRDVRQRDDYELPFKFPQPVLDPRSHVLEIERIVCINPGCIANRYTDLSNPTQAFDYERFVAAMERLISTNKQRGRSLRIKDGAHALCNLLCPIICGTFPGYPHIEVLRSYKHPVGIFEAALREAINPNYKRFSVFFECCTGLRCWANKVRDRETTGPDHLVAEPTHSPSVLDSIGFGKT